MSAAALRLLGELLRLMRGSDIGLLGLAQQLIGFVEMAGLDRRIGPRHEIARDRILRLEGRQPLHRLLVLSRHLGQLLRQLLKRDILLTQHAQQRQRRTLGDAKLLAQIDDLVRERPDRASRRRLRQLLHLLRRAGRR